MNPILVLKTKKPNNCPHSRTQNEDGRDWWLVALSPRGACMGTVVGAANFSYLSKSAF